MRDPITTDHGPVLQIGFSGADRVLAVSPILVSYVDVATGNTLAANVAPTLWSSLVTVPDGFITVDTNGALDALAARPAVPAAQAVPGAEDARVVARAAQLPRRRHRVDDVSGGDLMFDVFVSYAHEDVGLASALASGLGRLGKPWWRRRSLRVFRDANVMAASADLWDSIQGPLEESAWFVAVVSPAAAGSPWVGREIAWWVANRGPERLLVVLADGSCGWDDTAGDWAADATAVPPALRGVFDGEPRWVDASWTAGQAVLGRRDGRLIDVLAEVAAPVRGTTKDALVGEELRQHRRTVRTAVGAAGLLFVLTVASVIGAFVALDQRDKAESRRQQALSQSLAGQANEVAARRPDLGILLAVEAWRHAHTSQAEQALIEAAKLDGELPA